jgi:hypothetical protein
MGCERGLQKGRLFVGQQTVVQGGEEGRALSLIVVFQDLANHALLFDQGKQGRRVSCTLLQVLAHGLAAAIQQSFELAVFGE